VGPDRRKGYGSTPPVTPPFVGYIYRSVDRRLLRAPRITPKDTTQHCGRGAAVVPFGQRRFALSVRFNSKNTLSSLVSLGCALLASLTGAVAASPSTQGQVDLTGMYVVLPYGAPPPKAVEAKSADGAEHSLVAVGPDPGPGQVRLPGHIPNALLKRATPLTTDADSGVMPLTLTLRRDDEAGFQNCLQDVYAPGSPNFRHFLTQRQLTRRFGPSRAAYDRVRSGRRSALSPRAFFSFRTSRAGSRWQDRLPRW